ncbi:MULTISPECIES: beta-ketoacyl synthase N-terminal-like domain-containing protein [unclassified Microcoleus]|uniref:type I polyketide synthase n=1 Tax=unclassified Microcoleus TaxID=2642155 RepID=UPI001D2F98A0|nr:MULTISPECIES: beta-ketoacyl synthase N-terminal-like domain-containing protein [unclassified Microcoleus]MCC3472732.1 acyltransferase domain-containing protein [Microcoleus sp. PH2017_13_LAR_U_A]MCC3485142.1 acyltransferase domain-containing protein [Microcoleus sp. PH2017_14_LAR_D_A]MCC3597907.1 acyltransferase domain-containing protein [Microcoleus sp. PH2017_26_ELK_O_A]MCC3622893.1 acyltransferase domain-containing protein [Microcoleus sp. PH2017_36_ELK_O_B]
MDNSEKTTQSSLEGIAIVGMAGRFPGAKNVDEFWQNLRDGVESISFFSEQELESFGIDESVVRDPRYVKARAVLADIELFDASFFGLNPREAEITDPQHRFFLESAWQALENAGYNSETYEGAIGVYAGAGSFNTYFLNNLYPNRQLRESVGDFQLTIANEKDFLSTRVSYKLNLKGPSVTVQTACSTSLVAIGMACQSLLNYQCDMALAGGVSIGVNQKTGYFYKEGMILSPDGHCRAFDANAQGTVSGSGVGIVVLKRLEEAIADGDYIHAVIKGCAINNDGALKVGYTAPSIDGQAQAIADALAIAEIPPETVSYIEAHGTGTPLGDPIEIAALTQAFSVDTKKKGFCAIGSAKTNIGHLDTAAGVAGLIKTVQALKHQLIPPSLHFEQPNPKIDFANSPFYVNTQLSEWKAGKSPRRAGVSSFGIGGTNAHVVLEEAPIAEASGESRPAQLLVLSAKSSSALNSATANLSKYLQQNTEVNLADVAYTLQVGRKAFNHRRIVVCNDSQDGFTALENLDPKRVFTNFPESKNPPVVFMFSGQGSQYINMSLEVYQVEPTFREQIDLCSEILKPYLGIDLRHVLYPSAAEAEAATNQLTQTAIAQPALFAIEYALAKLWMSWGVHPQAMIGHSIGEYVAACLAGVFSLEEGLSLVAARGKLMQQLPAGSMLAVPLTEQQVKPLLGNKLDLAAINGASLSVISGAIDAVDELEQKLKEKGIEGRRLHTSHAFHSQMMEPILEPFTEQVKKVKLKSPKIPYISNVTGNWITAGEATSPGYYGQHLRQTVRFAEGLQQLLNQPNQILLEVGPGRTLNTLAKQHHNKPSEQIILSSLRHPQDQKSDVAFLLTTLGQLWLGGVQIDWSQFYADEQRYRLPLPTYPFERQRYWIEPPGIEQPIKIGSLSDDNSPNVDSAQLHSRPNLQNTYSVPRDEMEQTIATIWQEFLGIEQVGIDDDFFELGGDSLLAVQLITKLNEKLQKNLSPHSLLQSSTIAALAELIKDDSELSASDNRQSQSASESLLVEIRRGSLKQPLFLVHPVGGHVYIYRDLARYLGSERPIVGIQAPASVDETDASITVEAMATRYIEALQIRQPEGPYFLGGSSFGGTVAFEMAQQLNAIGQKVELLTLIDTPGPGQMPVLATEDDTAILVYILGVGFDLSLSLDVLQQLEQDEQLLYFLEQVKIANRVVPPDFGLPEIRHFLHLFKVHGQAMRNYIPQAYPGRIIFFRASEQNEVNPKNPELPWIEVAGGGIEVREVPGNHITMNYPPHVQVMAQQLREYID